MNIACLGLTRKHSDWERFIVGRCDLCIPKSSVGNAGITPLLGSGTAHIWGTFGYAVGSRGSPKLLRTWTIPMEHVSCAHPEQGHKTDHWGCLLIPRICPRCWPQQGLGNKWSSLWNRGKNKTPKVAEIFNSLWPVPLPWLFLLAQSFLWKSQFLIKSGGGGQMLVQFSFIVCQQWQPAFV